MRGGREVSQGERVWVGGQQGGCRAGGEVLLPELLRWSVLCVQSTKETMKGRVARDHRNGGKGGWLQGSRPQ